MKTTLVLLATVSILTIGCKSARVGWGRGESAQLPDWLQQFHRAVPFSDSVGWKAQAYRLPEPYELPARRLTRRTAIRRSAQIRIERYLELGNLLVHAGTYRTPRDGGHFTVPVSFECRHWFVVTGNGQLAVQRLDFYDRQSARLQLVFRRSDPVADIPDFALARPPAPDDQPVLQTFAISPKPFFYRQILPDTLFQGRQVSIEHYWHCKDRLLHLGTEQHIVGNQKCFLIQMGGEHWFRVTEREKTTIFRYILDETQPSLWQRFAASTANRCGLPSLRRGSRPCTAKLMFRPRLSNPSTSYPSRFNLFLVGGCAQFGGRQNKKTINSKRKHHHHNSF